MINTSNLKIEKGIPIPKRETGRTSKYNIIHQMEIGDSILFCNCKVPNLSPVVNKIKHTTRKNFTIRTIGKDIRLWRTK